MKYSIYLYVCCIIFSLIIKEFSDAPLPWVLFMSSAQDTVWLKEVQHLWTWLCVSCWMLNSCQCFKWLPITCFCKTEDLCSHFATLISQELKMSVTKLWVWVVNIPILRLMNVSKFIGKASTSVFEIMIWPFGCRIAHCWAFW